MDELDKIKDTIAREIDSFNVASFYNGLHVFSDAANKWKRSGGGKDWSDDVTTPTGKKAFETEAERAVVEEFFDALIESAVMVGGDGDAGDPGASATETIRKLAAEYVDPQKISMDLAYRRTTEFMDRMDAAAKDMARQIGIIKFQDSIPPIPLYQFGIPYELAPRTLVPIVNGLVELIRVFSTFGPDSADFLRVPLSVLTALIDLGRGDWKKAVLSIMGTFGRRPAAVGIFGKLLRDVFLFVSPDLTTEMRDTFYKSIKSFFAGVAFWSFSTFAPEPLYKMAEAGFAELSGIIKEINARVDEAEQTIMGSLPDAMKRCYDITFRRIPEGIIPEFDNLEALQAAFQAPELYCNPAVRTQIEAITAMPPVRLILELLNVPTLAEDFDKACAGIAVAGQSMEDAVLAAIKPIVRKKASCDIE